MMNGNTDEQIASVVDTIPVDINPTVDDVRDVKAVTEMVVHDPSNAVAAAKIETPIEEVEKSLVKFTTDMFDVARRDNVFREAMQNEILGRLDKMSADQLITLYNSDSVNRNDNVSKLLQPTFGLLQKNKEAEIQAKDDRVQIVNSFGMPNNGAIKNMNLEASQEVLQGLSQISLMLDAFKKTQAKANELTES